MSFTCRNCNTDFNKIGKEINRYVYHSFEVVVLEPIKPITKGHLMFVPTAHANDFTDSPELNAFLLGSIAEHCGKTKDANVVLSKGDSAGQKHYHLYADYIPRTKNDKIGIKL